jgi:hypothetical protein
MEVRGWCHGTATLPPEKEAQALTKEDVGWAPEPLWTCLGRREQALVPARNRTPDRTAHSLDTILTELSSLSLTLKCLFNCHIWSLKTKWLDCYSKWQQINHHLTFSGYIKHGYAIHKENPTRCNSVSKFYFIFMWSSTCFGQHTAHHQESKTALAASGFAYVKGCWTCSCWMLSASSNYTSNNPPHMQNQRLLVQF